LITDEEVNSALQALEDARQKKESRKSKAA